MTAYVLIQGGNGDAPLSGKLREVPGVLSAQDLSGPYDAIALTESADTSVRDVVARILEIPGVTHALPAPVHDAA